MERIHDIYRPKDERRHDWREVERDFTDIELKEQTSRCMNCGQPFCHAYGCPLGNLVPDQNRAVKLDIAKKAKALGYDAIHDTVHEMAKDEARHGAAFEGLLKRYFS